VPAMWMPQLQMEMLAADVPSALLVSRSATKVRNVASMHQSSPCLMLYATCRNAQSYSSVSHCKDDHNIYILLSEGLYIQH